MNYKCFFNEYLDRLKIKIALFPLERKLHCLRHFEKPEREALLNFASEFNLPYNELLKYFDAPGSKFLRSFAANPSDCLAKMKGSLGVARIIHERDSRIIACYNFSRKICVGGVGYSNTISKDDLDEDEKRRIVLTERDGITVGLIKSEKKYLTWKAVLVVDSQSIPSVTTLYPGELAPPLPDPDHFSGEELEQSRVFWDNHIFIE